MTVVAEDSTCAGCGRALTAHTRPRWVFTRDDERRPLGLMCAMCSVYRPRGKYDVVGASVATAEEAQFIAWTGIQAPSETDEARRMANVMAWAKHPSLDPRFVSEDQRRWLERYPSEQQQSIRAAYRELLTEFEEWRHRARVDCKPQPYDTPETVADKARAARSVIDRLRNVADG